MDESEKITLIGEFIESNYRAELDECFRVGNQSLTIDFTRLIEFDPDLAANYLEDPDNFNNNFQAFKLETNSNRNIKIILRVKNIPKTEHVSIRNIRSRHLNKILVIEGNVKNKSTVKAQVEEAKFECPSCGNVITILQLDTAYREPTNCSCGKKGKFTLISKSKSDLQYVSVEEPYEELGEDSVPQRIGVILKDDLTDPANQNNYLPGKPILISGILKEVPIIKNGKQSREIDWILEANYARCLEESLTKTTFSDKEIKEFVELSKDKKIYKRLIDSVAPHIQGNREVKEAILLFLVKGVRKTNDEGKTTREYFHILLMGDPGSGKSQLGTEIELLSWRSAKVVGRGASGPGLTASAERDEVLGMRVLQAGALPLCNEGHIVVDEVDKMDEQVQSDMHEAMEDGKISVSKASVQGTLKARTSVFMIGNPKFGRYDPYESLIAQIDLPKALVNRFDLIFPIKDEPNPTRDRKLAKAILNTHMNFARANQRPIDLRMFKNYLCYVSLNMKPALTEKPAKILEDYFCKLRDNTSSDGKNAGKKRDTNIGISGRQLEGLARMAEASAKLHMHKEVTEDDANIAIKLFDYSMKAFGIDPETGKMDIDRMTSGISASQRSKINQIKDIITDLEGRVGKIIPMDDVFADAQSLGFKHKEVETILDKLRQTGDIFEHKPGFISKI